MSLSLAANCGSLDSLNRRVRCGCKPCLRQMRCTELTLMPWIVAVVITRADRPGCGDDAAATSGSSGGMRDGRMLVTSMPATRSVHEALTLPAPDSRLADAGVAHDLGCAAAVRRQQHDLGSPDMLLRAVPVRHDRVQLSTILGTHCNFDPGAHPADSAYPARSRGILNRTQMSDFIHYEPVHMPRAISCRLCVSVPVSAARVRRTVRLSNTDLWAPEFRDPCVVT